MDNLQYTKITEQYADRIYRLAYSYCKNKSDAEDVVQNVFLKLFLSEQIFQDEEHIRKWLIRVAANECKNLLASFLKKRVIPMEEMEEAAASLAPEQSELFDAVMELPKKYSMVVHLYYYEEYSVREIAELLKIKETTVQTRLMRGRRQLKEKLQEGWSDERAEQQQSISECIQ